MSQIYENNLEALAAKNQELAERIQNLKIEKNDFSIIPTKDKSDYILEIEVDNKKKQVNSIYNPKKNAKNKIDNLNLDYYNLIGVMGIGCGYYIEELITRFYNKDSRIVIWENRLDILKEVLKHRDLTHIFESRHVEIFDGTNSDYYINMKRKLRNIIYMALLGGNVDFFELPAFKEKEKESYKKFKHEFISLLRYLAQVMGNSPYDSIIGVKNIFQNIEYLLKSVALESIDNFKNKPAVCVAAGPSLEKNIDVLQKYQDKVLIIAADTILEKLLNHNIIPDIVGVLERTEHPYDYFFKDLIENNKLPQEVTLVAEGVMDKRICNNFPGKKVITLRNKIYSEKWFADNIPGVTSYDSGNSVANLNFATALALDCSPIILIGQDLAFGAGDKQHVEGTGYDEKGEGKVEEHEIMEVDGYHGGQVKTKKRWWQFKQWFEYKIVETDVECIDATEGGAYIKGTIRMDLKEAIERKSNGFLNSFHETIDLASQDEVLEKGKDLKEAIDYKLEIFKDIKDRTYLLKNWIKEVLDQLGEVENTTDYILDIFPDLNKELVMLTRSDFFFYFICQPIIIEMERNKVRKGKLEEAPKAKFTKWCKNNLNNLSDIEKLCGELIDEFNSGKKKIDDLIAEGESK